MKRFFSAVADWFTVARRQNIQAGIATIVPVLVALHLVDDTTSAQWLIIATALLQAAGPLLSLAHLSVTDTASVASWWAAVGRGAIYTLALTVAPAVTALGYLTGAQASVALNVISAALTILSGLFAIITSGRQAATTPPVETISADGPTEGVEVVKLAS